MVLDPENVVEISVTIHGSVIAVARMSRHCVVCWLELSVAGVDMT